MSEQRENNYDVVVVGGGQAGLSMGFYLRRTVLSYVILDAQEKVNILQLLVIKLMMNFTASDAEFSQSQR